MKSEVFLMDCMEGMKQYPDKYFDLAIVDPPYGIGEDGKSNHSRGKICKAQKYTPKSWDKAIPSPEYFQELFRVSKNQIIWGGNYYIDFLKNTPCVIVWDKVNGETDFADCELAWTSFKTAVRKFSFMWNGMLQGSLSNGSINEGNKSKCEKRIHPTQKPIQLYKWLMQNYAPAESKILDTHLGSGSNRIAAYEMGLDFTGFEIDKEYFEASEKRYQNHISQLNLFKAS